MTTRDTAAQVLANQVKLLLDSRSERAIVPAGYALVGLELLDELAEALDDYTGLIDLEDDNG